MSTTTAQCVLAHEQGMRLDRYLDHDDLSSVQRVIAQLEGNNGSARAPRLTSTKGATNAARSIVFPQEFRTSDPLLSDTKLREAREMAAIYPILYVLENSLREVIKRVLAAKYGPDWWNTALTGGAVKTLKDTSDQRRASEDQMAWHQRRGAHPIDYVDLRHLGKIVEAKQDDFFPQVFDREWFLSHIRELAPSRNVLCHMNPLDETNVKSIRLSAERWRKVIDASLSAIPSN